MYKGKKGTVVFFLFVFLFKVWLLNAVSRLAHPNLHKMSVYWYVVARLLVLFISVFSREIGKKQCNNSGCYQRWQQPFSICSFFVNRSKMCVWVCAGYADYCCGLYLIGVLKVCYFTEAYMFITRDNMLLNIKSETERGHNGIFLSLAKVLLDPPLTCSLIHAVNTHASTLVSTLTHKDLLLLLTVPPCEVCRSAGLLHVIICLASWQPFNQTVASGIEPEPLLCGDGCYHGNWGGVRPTNMPKNAVLSCFSSAEKIINFLLVLLSLFPCFLFLKESMCSLHLYQGDCG